MSVKSNRNLQRIGSGIIFLLTLFYTLNYFLEFGVTWTIYLIYFCAIDFLWKVVAPAHLLKYSPLAIIVRPLSRFVTKFPVDAKMSVLKSATVGLIFTIAAIVLYYIDLFLISVILMAILCFFAGLQSFCGWCAACWCYSTLFSKKASKDAYAEAEEDVPGCSGGVCGI
ncbi:hypothetical protein PCE1_004308 [Barthelona sp. PCE]